MSKETYGSSPEMKLDKVVVTTAPLMMNLVTSYRVMTHVTLHDASRAQSRLIVNPVMSFHVMALSKKLPAHSRD